MNSLKSNSRQDLPAEKPSMDICSHQRMADARNFYVSQKTET